MRTNELNSNPELAEKQWNKVPDLNYLENRTEELKDATKQETGRLGHYMKEFMDTKLETRSALLNLDAKISWTHQENVDRNDNLSTSINLLNAKLSDFWFKIDWQNWNPNQKIFKINVMTDAQNGDTYIVHSWKEWEERHNRFSINIKGDKCYVSSATYDWATLKWETSPSYYNRISSRFKNVPNNPNWPQIWENWNRDNQKQSV